MTKGLLEGVKVLDLTRVLAGPYSSMLLADMGADVIKVEMPGKGDDSRAFAPFVNGESAYYMNLNRNKIGVTLNLKSEKGKEIFFELVKRANIVLENFRPGTMEKLGLGYEDLKKVNPSIIYGCVSGFGHYGPNSNRAGYDIIGQSYGGLMSTSGWPGGKPTRTGTAMADVLAGLGMTVGVLAALHRQKTTGEGEKVDVALVDSVVSSLEIINMIYLATGRVPERIGNRYESAYPYDSFETIDGKDVIIAAGNDKLFRILTEVMGQPELLEDPRFKDNPSRVANHEPLKVIVDNWSRNYTAKEVSDMLNTAGCPAGPINTIEDVVHDEHVAVAREMFVEMEHPVAGKVRITNDHIKLKEHPSSVRSHAPLLGQDNVATYARIIGLTEEEVRQYEADGIM